MLEQVPGFDRQERSPGTEPVYRGKEILTIAVTIQVSLFLYRITPRNAGLSCIKNT